MTQILNRTPVPIVSSRDGVKLLLSGGVPEHQPHLAPIVRRDDLLQEVHSDCLLVSGGEDALAKPPDQAALANTSVANDYNLRIFKA